MNATQEASLIIAAAIAAGHITKIAKGVSGNPAYRPLGMSRLAAYRAPRPPVAKKAASA